jgi:hypothetical protein
VILALKVPVGDHDNILIKAARERRSIRVSRDNGSVPQASERRSPELAGGELPWPAAVERRGEEGQPPMPVPEELINLLQVDSFVVVPLFSPAAPSG